MGHFNRGKKFGGDRGGDRGGKSFGGKKFGRSSGGGFGGGQGSMHQATCATCGKECEVPFRPTGNRPIYCRECFQQQGGAPAGGGRERSFDRPRGDDRRKPEFHADRGSDNRGLDQVKAQLDQVNAKLDTILRSLQAKPHASEQFAEEREEITFEDVEEKPVTKKKAVKKTKTKKKK